jgi:hypothetical protein
VVGGGIVAIATHPPAATAVEARDATVVAPTWREPAGVEAAVPKGEWVPVVGGRF